MLKGRSAGVLVAFAIGAIVSLAGTTPAAPAEAALDPDAMHVLAFGSCPPLLPKIRVCRHDVQQFAEAVQHVIGVPAAHVTVLSDEEATAAAVRAAFARLKGSIRQDATVIVYYVGHGMLVPKDDGGSGAEEAFLLWSASFPFAALYALHARIWMTDSELAGLIDSLSAESALVILDTCDAAGAEAALAARRPHSPQIAVVASSRAHEIAFADLVSAVFTRSLVEAMRGRARTLYEAFLSAREETAAEAALRCESAASVGSAGEDCTPQEPELVDPLGLTKRIRLNR